MLVIREKFLIMRRTKLRHQLIKKTIFTTRAEKNANDVTVKEPKTKFKTKFQIKKHVSRSPNATRKAGSVKDKKK